MVPRNVAILYQVKLLPTNCTYFYLPGSVSKYVPVGVRVEAMQIRGLLVGYLLYPACTWYQVHIILSIRYKILCNVAGIVCGPGVIPAGIYQVERPGTRYRKCTS